MAEREESWNWHEWFPVASGIIVVGGAIPFVSFYPGMVVVSGISDLWSDFPLRDYGAETGWFVIPILMGWFMPGGWKGRLLAMASFGAVIALWGTIWGAEFNPQFLLLTGAGYAVGFIAGFLRRPADEDDD